MTKIKDVMTSNIEVVSPDCTVEEAARRMRELDVGALPVCNSERILGMVTDRDIVLRVVATGARPSECTVSKAMTSPITYCYEDQDIKEVAAIMESKQIRRLVVLNKDKRLKGVVSLGDIAVRTTKDKLTGETLEKISEPSRGKAA